MHGSGGAMPDGDATQEQTSGPSVGGALHQSTLARCLAIIAKCQPESWPYARHDCQLTTSVFLQTILTPLLKAIDDGGGDHSVQYSRAGMCRLLNHKPLSRSQRPPQLARVVPLPRFASVKLLLVAGSHLRGRTVAVDTYRSGSRPNE